MNNEKEIEEMAKVLFESGVALDATDFAFGVDGDDHFTRLAIKLVNAGYGNVKQAVMKFVLQVLKRADDRAIFQEWYNYGRRGGRLIGMDGLKCVIDDLITELYGADE